MAVVVRYIVERNGVEKMSFASKKEADAYDRMLDMVEALDELLAEAPVSLEADQRDELAMFLAQRKDVLGTILKSGKKPSGDTGAKGPKNPGDDTRNEKKKVA